MSLLVVGSTALDTIHTPQRTYYRLLGGSASYAAIAASFFDDVKLVGIVGSDFPKKYLKLFQQHNIDIAGLQIVPGQTFFWEGEYEKDMNKRRTIKTILGVFENFRPTLPPDYQNVHYVLLANISPSLQLHVLKQLKEPKFVAADTMDLWINTALVDLKKLIRQIDLIIMNDTEAQTFTHELNLFQAAKKIHRLGPKYVIIKKGEHGSILSSHNGLTLIPAYPIERVKDTTGAGDSFAGALMGFISSQEGDPSTLLPQAMLYGAVVASFCCEGVGLQRLARLTIKEIDTRMNLLRNMLCF